MGKVEGKREEQNNIARSPIPFVEHKVANVLKLKVSRDITYRHHLEIDFYQKEKQSMVKELLDSLPYEAFEWIVLEDAGIINKMECILRLFITERKTNIL